MWPLANSHPAYRTNMLWSSLKITSHFNRSGQTSAELLADYVLYNPPFYDKKLLLRSDAHVFITSYLVLQRRLSSRSQMKYAYGLEWPFYVFIFTGIHSIDGSIVPTLKYVHSIEVEFYSLRVFEYSITCL